MKAVFERHDGKIATFLLEDIQKCHTISYQKIQKDLEVGDVVEVKLEGDELIILEKLPEERKRREDRIRQKREKLLKRSKKRKG